MKEFKAFGVASKEYESAQLAADDTYTTKDGKLESTQLIFKENPFNEDIKNAKNIFEIGFGVGRNVKWIMENTDADYWGVEPNKTMFDNFWEYNDPKYKDRIYLFNDFNIPEDLQVDVVISTFVFQHIGYMTPENIMNVSDIAKEIKRFTNTGTVWILLEHDSEDDWINRFLDDIYIKPDVYIRTFKGLENMTHRDHCTKDGHHLIIWKEK